MDVVITSVKSSRLSGLRRTPEASPGKLWRPDISAKSAIARKQRPQSAKRERPDYGVADRRLVEAGDNFFDAGLARFGANLVGEVAAAPERFFVALGFRQPHLPWMATRPLWDSSFRRADFPLMHRGDAAAATRILRGDESIFL